MKNSDDTQAKMIPKPTLLILTTTALSLILTVMNNLLKIASQQSMPRYGDGGEP